MPDRRDSVFAFTRKRGKDAYVCIDFFLFVDSCRPIFERAPVSDISQCLRNNDVGQDPEVVEAAPESVSAFTFLCLTWQHHRSTAPLGSPTISMPWI